MVLICPNPCLWRRSFRSNVGGIHSKKLYLATLRSTHLNFNQWITKLLVKISNRRVLGPLAQSAERGADNAKVC